MNIISVVDIHAPRRKNPNYLDDLSVPFSVSRYVSMEKGTRQSKFIYAASYAHKSNSKSLHNV